MTDPTAHPGTDEGRRSELVIEQLTRRGFRATPTERHVVLERDALRVVVPAADREVPGRVVRMIEAALAPNLGADWMSGTAAPLPRLGRAVHSDTRTVHVVDALVFQDSPLEPWCAVAADQLALVGFGPDRDAALRDLKLAAAAWMGVDPDDVALLTPTVL